MSETAVVQARLSRDDIERLDADRQILALESRSDAIRASLLLLHRQARHVALAQDYDAFYGENALAPVSEIVAMGDVVAAEAMTAKP